MSSFRDRSCWCKRACAEIADVAYSRDNRLSDPSFRRDGPRGQRIVADRRQRDVEDSVPEASAADSPPLFASFGASLWARLTSSHGGKPNVLNLCALYDSMHFFHGPVQVGYWEPQPPNWLCSRIWNDPKTALKSLIPRHLPAEINWLRSSLFSGFSRLPPPAR